MCLWVGIDMFVYTQHTHTYTPHTHRINVSKYRISFTSLESYKYSIWPSKLHASLWQVKVQIGTHAHIRMYVHVYVDLRIFTCTCTCMGICRRDTHILYKHWKIHIICACRHITCTYMYMYVVTNNAVVKKDAYMHTNIPFQDQELSSADWKGVPMKSGREREQLRQCVRTSNTNCSGPLELFIQTTSHKDPLQPAKLTKGNVHLESERQKSTKTVYMHSSNTNCRCPQVLYSITPFTHTHTVKTANMDDSHKLQK